jgi:DNA repair exonuclease SbcCD ATPase subunit
MRQIFIKLQTSPKPCLEEKKWIDEINDNITKSDIEIIGIQSQLDACYADLIFCDIKIDSHHNAIQEEEDKEKSLLEKISIRKDEVNSNCKYIPSASCYYSQQKLNLANLELVSSRERIQKLKKDLESAKKVLAEAKKLIPAIEANKNSENQKLEKWLKYLDKAKAAYKACLNKNFNQSFNSKPLCKQIKQKIKKVNKKIISTKHKSLNIKQGVDSLTILNINKKLSDKKIKSTKELIVKLDKLNPIIFISKKLNNVTPNSSFYPIYKKVKDDLASYQTEGKTLEIKLKKLKIKEKTIIEKKNKLKTKFSKLIKKLKTC